eukprot:TRINITY_DN14701_c0_g2_i1.p1 TRINITY_DN14701_c0_g2~~TRINITY_DN14701_c0_g2_i1.p1  ORF type:complete len:714 (-),score=166.10 TRINITY_DN14701_c0_g2_i1:108-2249(-)
MQPPAIGLYSSPPAATWSGQPAASPYMQAPPPLPSYGQNYGGPHWSPPAAVSPSASYSENVVPVDHASSKLWGMTLEYEHLLNVQRDQHQLSIQRHEAEALQLRQAVQMLQRGSYDEASIAARLEAKDREVQLTLQAKHKELELVSSLLKVRDRQIGELQEACASKKAGNSQEDSQNLAKALMQIEDLRREKDELEKIIVAKDRQISAVQAINPDMADSSALQLGAQAIQMFHDSLRLKSEAADFQEENQALRNEVEELQSRVEELEATVAEKRGEIKELVATMNAKMQRVISLETEVEWLRREKQQTLQNGNSQLDTLKEELTSWQTDCKATQQFVEELKAQLCERDQRFVNQQEECSKYIAMSKELTTKVQEMGSQLAHAEEALAQMLRSNNYKDQIVREMTEQVNVSETKLHSYQINELIGSRQRLLEQSGVSGAAELLRDLESLQASGFDVKEDPGPAKPALISRFGGGSSGRGSYGGQSASEAHGRHAVFALNSDLGEHTFGVMEEFKASNPLQEPVTASVRPSSPAPTDVSGPAGSPMSYQSLRHTDETQALGRNQGYELGVASGSVGTEGCGSAPSRPGSSIIVTKPAQGTSSPSSSRLHRQVLSAALPASATLSPILVAQSYRPHPGDPIDAKVAEFVNQPKNSASKALFCRLAEGSYLYGTKRASLRVNVRTDLLEALVDSNWVSIEEFVQQMQPTESVHLRAH